MFANSFRRSIEESSFYDAMFELRNLKHEELLKKAAGQQLLIKQLEKAHIEHLREIDTLKEQNKKLGDSLLILTSKG
jgi:heterodisulfide reductase subunit A-like polyferredoxin